jgi:hypothetical protein
VDQYSYAWHERYIPVRESNVDVPVLPLQNPPFHGVTDTFGLNDVKRLEGISELEIWLVNRELLREVVVRSHRRCEWSSFLAGLVCLCRTGRESLAGTRVHRRVVDRKYFTCMRVDDWNEIARVGVQVVVGSQTGKDETLLQSTTRESFIGSNTPSYLVRVAGVFKEGGDSPSTAMDD